MNQGPLHYITQTEANQQGYKCINGLKSPLHHSIEDVVWSGCTQCGARVYILADGHGGAGASNFFTVNIGSKVMDLLESKVWDLEVEHDRTLLQQEIEHIFIQIDNDYTQLKYTQFAEWFPTDSPERRPDDDGCTLILNILMSGYMINANLGDSRTLLISNSELGWGVEFSSVDHNTTNPQKVQEIIKNGGYFISRKGQIYRIPVSTDDLSVVENSLLAAARIYRPPSVASLAIGLSHRRTLNLTGSLGDIHFKLDPPVLSSVPDISIVKLDDSKEYILISGSDGIWDHLKSTNYLKQNLMVKNHICSMLDGGHENIIFKGSQMPLTPNSSDTSFEESSIFDRLTYVAQSLTRRENPISQDLFHQCQMRYDDASVQIIHLSPKEGSNNGEF